MANVLSPPPFDPANVNLTDADDDLIREITCYLKTGENEYNGGLGK